MCSHYVGQMARDKLACMGASIPADWEPPPGRLHIYPTQVAPIIRRPLERDSGDSVVPEMEVVPAHFGLLRGFVKRSTTG